jgi:hypothetical protein
MRSFWSSIISRGSGLSSAPTRCPYGSNAWDVRKVQLRAGFPFATSARRAHWCALDETADQKAWRIEEFRYQSNPRAGKLLAGNLTLSDGARVLRDYVITVDAMDGKIVVKGHGVTMQQTLTNALHVKNEDWSKFLSAFYAGNMR